VLARRFSLTTFREALSRMNFKSRVAAKKPALNPRHKDSRLARVKERINWTKDDWNKVVWSDEAKFTLKSASVGTRVIIKDGERCEERHIKGTHKFGLVSVMVWGCFHTNGVGPLVVQHGSIDQKVYVQCLVDYYLPWIEKESEKTNIEYILQEDNAPCHVGAYSSSDLNLIENAWAYPRNRLNERESDVNTLSNLERVLKEEWYRLMQEYLINLVGSKSSTNAQHPSWCTDRISRIMVKNQFTIDLINTSLLDVPAGTYKTGDSMFIDGTKCDVLYFPRSADLANLSSEVVEIQHTVTHEFMCRAVQYCLNSIDHFIDNREINALDLL
ncbi:Transposable element Tc1 transposase, partial [Choanephora cucurbitarum]